PHHDRHIHEISGHFNSGIVGSGDLKFHGESHYGDDGAPATHFGWDQCHHECPDEARIQDSNAMLSQAPIELDPNGTNSNFKVPMNLPDGGDTTANHQNPNWQCQLMPNDKVPHGTKEKVPDNPKGSNSQNPKEKDRQNPNEIVPQNPKKQVVADTFPFPHGSPVTIVNVFAPLPDSSPISMLVVGVDGGMFNGQEDVIKDLETLIVVQNSTPVACDPPDSVFIVCNLNSSGCRDFDADKYRQIFLEDDIISDSEDEPINTIDDAHALQLIQTFGATTSQMSYTQMKEFIDRQGLSPRGATHFSPSSRTGPPATWTRLRVKTFHSYD
ncbi:hypothetical protein HAX54_037906, partial [Datura stramonium]|nr:hypothetical protein [Datura stramonium]